MDDAMDTFIAILNGSACAIIAIGLFAAVLSERVRDGVVIKIGLGCMALGFFVIALHMLRIRPDVQGLERSLLFINSGLAVVIIGYLFRTRHEGHALRRLTDWADLDGANDEEASPPPASDRRKGSRR